MWINIFVAHKQFMEDTDPLISNSSKKQSIKVKKHFWTYLKINRHFQTDFGDIQDITIILILTFFGILTRIYRVQFPSQVLNQERIIGEQINKYYSGDFFQDFSNPPISSLFYFYISQLSDYSPQFDYSFNTSTFNKERFPIQFRTISAILSGFCVPLIYCSFRLISPSIQTSIFSNRVTSFSCSTLYLFETSLLSQGRYFFIDGLFQFLFVLSLFFIFFEDYIGNPIIFIGKNLIVSLLFTTNPVRSIGLIFTVIFKNFINYRPREFVDLGCSISRTIFLLVFILFCQYIQYFFHISLLPYKSQSTEKCQSYIDHILIPKNETNLRKRSESVTLFTLFRISTYLILFHASDDTFLSKEMETSPLKWPFGNFLKAIVYADDYNHGINPSTAFHHYYLCFPNIIIYSLVIIFFVISIVDVFRGISLTIQQRVKRFCYMLIFLRGYFLSWLPFLFMSHTYLYQYSSSLIFGIFLISYFIELHIKPNISVWINMFIILLFFLNYILVSPYIYGLRRPYRSFD